MTLEPVNIICPKCGNGNYMRRLVGKGVGELDMKCINCNTYFNFEELYKQKIAEIVNHQTNADRIRSMSDDELAGKFEEIQLSAVKAYSNDDILLAGELRKYWLDWLKHEAE